MTFQDLDGVRHTTEVMAETLYEAACLAVKAFKESGLVDQTPGPASRFEIEVKAAPVRHVVTVGQVRPWVEMGSTNPMEEAHRKRLRALFG